VQVVGELKRFFADADLLALRGRQTLDLQQAITVVVHIILTGIGIELGQQPANSVALELGTALWPFGVRTSVTDGGGRGLDVNEELEALIINAPPYVASCECILTDN
jgi:hypothetical protein